MAGLYLHIPFCSKACHYCDFHFSTDTRYREEMITCIIHELELQQELPSQPGPGTIYLGGGTPSLLFPAELERLFIALHRLFRIDPHTEITLEANPEDLTMEKLKHLYQLGVNRLSIGVQSFHEETLRMMNRSHSAEQAKSAIQRSREAGFKNLSLDLIFAVPGRTTDLLKQDLDQLLSHDPEHISTYGLTIEERTVFGKRFSRGQFTPASEDQNADEFELIMDTLGGAGYRQYEVSNFARTGFLSAHNSNYWQDVPYLGVGPGAHSYTGNERFSNLANNHRYMTAIREDILPRTVEVLGREERINEYLMTSLRLDTGCDLTLLQQKFGHEPGQDQQRTINGLLANGSAVLDRERLVLTRKGRLIADQIAAELFVVRD